jgi:hypothetical protein
MAFEEYINKPTHELELFLQLSEDLRKNIRKFKDNYLHFEIKNCGDGLTAISSIREFNSEDEIQDFYYYNRHGMAFIEMCSSGECLKVRFIGYHYSYLCGIDKGNINVMFYEKSEIARTRHKPPFERRGDLKMAFAELSGSLVSEPARKKTAI